MAKEVKTTPIQFRITKEGSLGILALGAVGVSAWREFKRKNEEPKKK